MAEIIQIKSIVQLHNMLHLPEPKHPLISAINVTDLAIGEEMLEVKVVANLYCVALKDEHCGLEYGRQQYDFENGSLLFTAPNQVLSATKTLSENEEEGWLLFFHPDLIRKTHLAQQISAFSFFEYNTNEALHLSEREQETLSECINIIKNEYEQRIDAHSQKVIVSSLALLLNYSLRFYERQFNTRSIQYQGVISKFEQLINDYFNSDLLLENGIPNTTYFANKVHLSTNYLSDLLRKETGSSTKDHINKFIAKKAKDMLIGTNDSVSEIAYSLGFNYPHYFTRFFKSQTGKTPVEFRNLN